MFSGSRFMLLGVRVRECGFGVFSGSRVAAAAAVAVD